MMNKLMARALSQAASSPGPTKWISVTSSLLRQHSSRYSSYSSSYALDSTVPTTTSLKKQSPRKQNPPKSVPKSSSSHSAPPELELPYGGGDRGATNMGVSGKWPRPSEIPWQAKVANSVSLIGTVQTPVHFEAADGMHFASTVISEASGPNADQPLRIQVTFQGDLAHVAACHLKEKDCIHVGGQLSGDLVLLNPGKVQTNIQVLVSSLDFVQQSSPVKKTFATETVFATEPMEKLDSGSVDSKKDAELTTCSWRNLFENTHQWLDFRAKKLSGSVNPRFPDFKSKDGKPLWLNKAPEWVLEGLQTLNFESNGENLNATKNFKARENLKAREDLWKNYVENPDKWWDNRLNKRNPKAPDFKHKDSGEGLWLSSAPEWAQSKLPPVKTKPEGTAWTKKTLLS